MPCVPGRTCKRSVLPNFEGSSARTPALASATIPTPLAEPIPLNITARAAPISAKFLPLSMDARKLANVVISIFL